MPAAAVASLTPLIGGRSGNCAGASGETALDMCFPRSAASARERKGTARHRLARSLPLGSLDTRLREHDVGEKSQFSAFAPARERPQWAAGFRERGRWSVLLRLRLRGRLVQAFDLGGLAQLADELALRLARQEGLDLVLHLVELRRLLGALVLELDDVPAELRLHRVRQLARIH